MSAAASSSSADAVIVPADTDIRYMVIDDIEHNGYTFTDGCGIVSHNMAVRMMAAKGKMWVHGLHYLPSAYQVHQKRFSANICYQPLLQPIYITVCVFQKGLGTQPA
jgi:hypothetical protein